MSDWIELIIEAKQIGVNENTLGNWMDGRSMPRLDQAVRLAKKLNCKVDDLWES